MCERFWTLLHRQVFSGRQQVTFVIGGCQRIPRRRGNDLAYFGDIPSTRGLVELNRPNPAGVK